MSRYGALPGLIAGTVSLLGWVWAIFGPTTRYSTVETRFDTGTIVTTSGWTSIRESQDLETITVVFLIVMLVSILGVLAGAILHGRFRAKAGRALLWIFSIVLLAGAALSAFSIGLLLLPGAILALTAAALAGSTPDRDSAPSQPR